MKNIIAKLKVDQKEYSYFSLEKLAQELRIDITRLPFSIKILLENLVRHYDGHIVTEETIANLATWGKSAKGDVPFMPARVLMQDYSGFPAVLDLASMREAFKKQKGDPAQINPLIPSDLVIDHSLIVNFSGNKDSLRNNLKSEFEQNRERYEFLKWASKAFNNFRVVPPGRGIVHQVNLEYLGRVVQTRMVGGDTFVFPDSLVGTDSHTPMINGLGIVGWGVGGIEAEGVMLGQPIYLLTPDVVGVEIVGKLNEGVTATDLVLNITQLLRKHGVVNKFVEFFGEGLDNLSLPDRATIANMAPEYGATIAYFPVDNTTLEYLQFTGRESDLIELIEKYCKTQSLFRENNSPIPEYTEKLVINISEIQSSIAGPKRPQDRINLGNVKRNFEQSLLTPLKENGYELSESDVHKKVDFEYAGETLTLKHGSIVIAAITSCTNTSNPTVMIGAGLIAKKAVELGLKVSPFIKTSLAPGSRVVTEYLEAASLLSYLETLGFNIVGYGCTTCVGNSGPLVPEVVKAIEQGQLITTSILSGNRNFEGRIHSHTKANYLASPPLVVLYALAGRINIDFENEAIAQDKNGNDVFLRDLWPKQTEINALMVSSLKPEMFVKQYADIFQGSDEWKNLNTPVGELYQWHEKSTYIKDTPFFRDIQPITDITGIHNARVLIKLGDSITTDHISPVGSIAAASPAGEYLKNEGVEPKDFNAYGARRGNHEVMVRGIFANVRLRNQLVPNKEGWFTQYFPEQKEMTIYDASMRYQKDQTQLLILAGKDYGMGSARDWAAKGTMLLGIKAVIFESIERIHRSNLIGMGVLPLQFQPGENAKNLGLSGKEIFNIKLDNTIKPGSEVEVEAVNDQNEMKKFKLIVRLDTLIEIEYFRYGGILNYVFINMLMVRAHNS